MEGVAESEYEKFMFYIDDVLTVTVQATDSPACQVSTCNMCEVSMAEQEVNLTSGSHTLRIEITTVDPLYHLNAYFRIDFTIKQKPICNDCKCPATCTDGKQNGDEEGVDCGGSGGCPACPTCIDGIQNGDEEGVDCGGTGGCSDCPTCSDGIQN